MGEPAGRGRHVCGLWKRATELSGDHFASRYGGDVERGASGTGAVLATRGKEVRVGSGADVTTRLTAPLTVGVRLS